MDLSLLTALTQPLIGFTNNTSIIHRDLFCENPLHTTDHDVLSLQSMSTDVLTAVVATEVATQTKTKQLEYASLNSVENTQ